jgi:hypothetical protein
MSTLFEKDNLIEGSEEYESKYGKIIAHFFQGRLTYTIEGWNIPNDVLEKIINLPGELQVKANLRVKRKRYGYFEESSEYGKRGKSEKKIGYRKTIEISVDYKSEKSKLKELLKRIEENLGIKYK